MMTKATLVGGGGMTPFMIGSNNIVPRPFDILCGRGRAIQGTCSTCGMDMFREIGPRRAMMIRVLLCYDELFFDRLVYQYVYIETQYIH